MQNSQQNEFKRGGRVQGGPGVSRGSGFQGGPGGGPEVLGGKTVKNTKKPEKRSGAVWLDYYAATSRILCRRFQ